MKRRILEITEIDCGDETCDEDSCKFFINADRFPLCSVENNYPFRSLKRVGPQSAKRSAECLEAERRYKKNYIDPLVKYRMEPA